MNHSAKRSLNLNSYIVLLVLALITSLICIPSLVSNAPVTAESISNNTLETRIENYDIRTDKNAAEQLSEFRAASDVTAADAADAFQRIIEAENRLRAKVPTLKVEYDLVLKTPSVISTNPKHGNIAGLASKNTPRPNALKTFVDQNAELFGFNTENSAGDLSVTADYTNPNGKISFVHLTQSYNGIPVFQGEIKAGFSSNGELFRIVNNLAPGGDSSRLSSDFGDPIKAVKVAYKSIKPEDYNYDLIKNETVSDDQTIVLGKGDWATKTKKTYFPIKIGSIRTAWEVLVWLPDGAFLVVIDAETGTILWQKNLTEHQTQTATYKVFSNTAAMIPVADSPNPFTPGPLSPEIGAQGSRIQRTSVTRIGNEPPYTFNLNGWITDGQNTTDGNAVEAGLDRENPDGIDPAGKPNPNENRNFAFEFNPSNPSGVPDIGESPLPIGVTPGTCDAEGTSRPMTEFQKASVTQLFYISNWFHDETYLLGFTEAARNFQHDNFGRGGLGEDRISVEAQECTGTNRGGFATAPDGERGRMQLYIWTLPEPDHDGALDAQVAVHELAHGLSNRLIGNATGLTTNMARAMGEGWSDIYAHSLLSSPADPITGIYTIGGYSNYRPLMPSNNYYGVRRFPLAVMSSTGGPDNRPHNPLTLADIDSTQYNIMDGAFAPAGLGGSADQVHNAGEVWSAALWEVRARFIQRLGWETGNRNFLQFVTDGMKLTPLGPTFLQSRDAILMAALASGTSADVGDIWAGFAIRGMGISASIQVPGSGNGNARVTEAFDAPNLTLNDPLVILDQTGNNNGFPDPGEQVIIRATVTNATGTTADSVSIHVIGTSAINIGSIGHGASKVTDIPFTVPTAASCGSALNFSININSSLGSVSFTRMIDLGSPQITYTENFDTVNAPVFPAGWTAETILGGINFTLTTNGSSSTPNTAFAQTPSTVGGGTDLISPLMNISSAAASVSFMNRYNTEAGWDGGVLEISVNGGEFQDIISAGGSFVTGGYNSILGANGTNNPLNGRPAWSGSSSGYIQTKVRLPSSAAGGNVRFRWRSGADNNTAVEGWYIDSISVVGDHACTTVDNFKAPFDFDGDKKTDISIFRTQSGEWWIERSSGGVTAAQFGNASDIIVPADYTGDGKDDIAVFRPLTAEWFILRSEDGSYYSFPFGTTGDIAVPADYDGDGKADAAVFRPSDGKWYVLRSSDLQVVVVHFGIKGDIPVSSDFDADGKADQAVYRPSVGQWWIAKSSGGILAYTFGSPTDIPITGDFTGDGKSDTALWRSSTGEWFILRSEDLSYYSFPFGNSTDISVPGDYDGDGKIDAAVFRPSSGVWYLLGTSSGFQAKQFGLAIDHPVPSAFLYPNY